MRMCSRFANPGGSEAVFCTISFFISFLREPDNCSRAPFHSFMGIVRLLKFCESIQHVSFHTATASPMPIQVQQVPQSYVWSIPRRVWGAGFLREITQWLWRKSIITYSDRQDCAANKTRDDTDWTKQLETVCENAPQKSFLCPDTEPLRVSRASPNPHDHNRQLHTHFVGEICCFNHCYIKKERRQSIW